MVAAERLATKIFFCSSMLIMKTSPLLCPPFDPAIVGSHGWTLPERTADTVDGGKAYPLQARSMALLMERRSNGGNNKKEESNEAQA